ncbi:MAG: hypothetical protein HOP37_06980, partial [Cyclobacteriaceae bacterium]|nr:hypothetical protein [Cyclobacteriaceae bacterium]
IGDAAHATTPNLGQGGCQAVEDAFVIAKCLRENYSYVKAFEKFQNIRYKKAVHVVNTSWKFGKMTNIENSLLQSMQNGLVVGTFTTGARVPRLCPIKMRSGGNVSLT